MDQNAVDSSVQNVLALYILQGDLWTKHIEEKRPEITSKRQQ